MVYNDKNTILTSFMQTNGNELPHQIKVHYANGRLNLAKGIPTQKEDMQCNTIEEGCRSKSMQSYKYYTNPLKPKILSHQEPPLNKTSDGLNLT